MRLRAAEMTEMKRILRQDMLLRRRERLPAWIEAQSWEIARRLMALPEFQCARVVCLYLALPGEPRTDTLLRRSWETGRQVCVPAWDGIADYAPAWYAEGAPLKKGPKGVLEPAEKIWVEAEVVDLVVIPGVAFDAHGGRLGHGGGHYDRMLRGPALRRAFRAALAFEYQIVPAIPRGDGDEPMDVVVTEMNVYRTKDVAAPMG